MSRRVTITELARRLGISVCTVNKALSGKPKVSQRTRERVVAEARRLGYRPNRMAQVLARNPVRLAYLHPAHFASFFAPFEAGVCRAAEQLAEQQVSVSVHAIPPSSWGSSLSATIRTLVRKGLSGLIVSPISGFDYTSVWELLAERRLPLVQLGLEVPGAPAALTVRQDTLLSGRMAAELLSHARGPAAIVIGNRCVVDHDEKVRGFQAEATRRGLAVAAVCEHDDDPRKGYSATCRLLDQHPDLRGIYIATDNFGGVARALKTYGTADRIRVIATGVFPAVRAAMEAGQVQFAFDQRMSEQAELAVHQLHELLSHRPLRAAKILVPPRIAICSNLDVIAAGIGSEHGFEDDPSKEST